jgi:uncharacterized protein with HEPN domain
MREVLDRLRDAPTYALAAGDNALGLSPEILAEAKQPLHAALYDLVVIGEALGKIPEEIRSLALGIIDEVVENRLDPLVAAIDRLIAIVEIGDP